MLNLRRGIFSKPNYNLLELANKIYTPSYISLETVLAREGVIFQSYQTIFVVSYLTRKIEANGHKIYYRKIKDPVLLNNQGLIDKDNYFTAIKERAFLDALFLYKNYHFDNLKVLDWNLIKYLSPIYQSQSLNMRIKEYYRLHLEENAR